MSHITGSETYDTVVVVWDFVTRRPLIIEARNGGAETTDTLVGTFYTAQNANYLPSNTGFADAVDGIKAGTKTLYYRFGSDNYQYDSYVPLYFWAWNNCPVARAVGFRRENVGPVDKLFYKRSSSVPSKPDVTYDGRFESGDVELINDLEDLEWYPDNNITGTDTLYSIVVTYSYDADSGVSDTLITTPTSSSVQYSTDGGTTFTSSVTDSDDVTHIQYWTRSGTLVIPVATDDKRQTLIGSTWHSSANQAFVTVGSKDASKWTAIGVKSSWRKEWAGNRHNVIKSEGYAEMSLDKLPKAYPGDFRLSDGRCLTEGREMMLRHHKWDGYVTLSLPLINTNTSHSRWDDLIWRTFAIMHKPKTWLTTQMTATTTTMRVFSANGMAVGDTLLVDDEQMTITAINRTQTSVSDTRPILEADSSRNLYQDTLTVSRGAKSTTAGTHIVNERVHVDTKSDVVTGVRVFRGNWAAPYQIFFYGVNYEA